MARRIPTLKAKSHFKQRLLFGMVFKPLRLFCDHCDKYVPSDMPWRCSHCSHENERTRIHSFLNKCRNCKRSPKAYACPHCGQFNFLDTDREVAHPALPVGRPPAAESTTDPRKEKLRERIEQKESLEHEIVIARLDAELKHIKESAEFKKEKSARESLEKSFSEHDAHMMGAHALAREQRRKNAETYKDDPELRTMADESVQHWLEQQF